MHLYGIVAMGKRKQIGLKNKLPWNNSLELDHFKSLTLGGILIMGRKTFESIGKPLAQRHTIVISSKDGENKKNVFFVKSPGEALDLVSFMKRHDDSRKVWVCGGEKVYKQFLSNINTLVVSEMEYDGKADSFFPDFEDNFHCRKMEHKRGNGFKVFYYERVGPGK